MRERTRKPPNTDVRSLLGSITPACPRRIFKGRSGSRSRIVPTLDRSLPFVRTTPSLAPRQGNSLFGRARATISPAGIRGIRGFGRRMRTKFRISGGRAFEQKTFEPQRHRDTEKSACRFSLPDAFPEFLCASVSLWFKKRPTDLQRSFSGTNPETHGRVLE